MVTDAWFFLFRFTTRRSDGCASGGEHREDLSGSGGSGQGALTLVVDFARCDARF